ncbi:MAG: flagellar basal body M-ring protein FliF [Gammaproteobacteria bacterium]|nr:MAG: flagellar basal body M-ring protein FliF [Gammaproteobacteria bacterium]
MAGTLPQTLTKQFAGLSELPAHRQFGLIIGLAVVAALAVSLLLWGMRPTYQVLLPGMAERDTAQAIAVLDRHNIAWRLDNGRGALMVPSNRIAEARLQLATEGLPRAEGVGFELLDKETGLGTSRMVETARYQRALEGEITRSVVTLQGVESARVHLALPRQSVFLRDRAKASASVLVNLHPGRQLDDHQVAGIVHLVAASVPELDADQVTVVDQRGRLLSQNGGGDLGSAPGRQLDYTRKVEDAFRQRVEDILRPLLGDSGMRVQVTADVDFTRTESTREIFDPDARVLRSEQTSDEETRGGVLGGGVPGALTNQPPAAGAVGVRGEGAQLDEAAAEMPGSINRRATRNFEVDRTVSHVREAPGSVRRLSVAVVVDHRDGVDEDGARIRVPRDAEEMAYLDGLVREAVGFRDDRGDRVNVVNASFREIEAPAAELDAPPLWQEPWVHDLARQGLAGLGLLLLVLLVLRPALRSLAQSGAAAARRQPLAIAGGSDGAPDTSVPQAMLEGGGSPVQLLSQGRTTEEDLARARQLAGEDPRLVAQVVRQWMVSHEK